MLSLRVVQRSLLLGGRTLSRCPLSSQNVLSDLCMFSKVVLNQRGFHPHTGDRHMFDYLNRENILAI